MAPGETTYFNCYARGNPVQWYINGVILYNRNQFIERGFLFHDEILSNGDVNYTIAIVAQIMNNNTRLECRAHSFNEGDIAQIGTLLIAGEPSLLIKFSK